MLRPARKRQQARERQRRHRARKRAESATQPPEDAAGAEGSTVDAVRDELDEIPAADRQPGAAAALPADGDDSPPPPG